MGYTVIADDAFQREICGFSTSTKTLKQEQSIDALMKLQICVCAISDFFKSDADGSRLVRTLLAYTVERDATMY